jgi:hypothetical protein
MSTDPIFAAIAAHRGAWRRLTEPNVLLRRHVLDNIREHFADFLERCLRCHMGALYHSSLSRRQPGSALI